MEVEFIEYFKISKVMLSGHAATSTILISAFLRSAYLERAAHYRKFSEARDYTTAEKQGLGAR